MPTKTKEYSLYDPGSLVVCRTDVYSSSPIDGDAGNKNMIPAGFRNHFQVQFLGKILWWVRPDEIEPYVDYFYGKQK